MPRGEGEGGLIRSQLERCCIRLECHRAWCDGGLVSLGGACLTFAVAVLAPTISLQRTRSARQDRRYFDNQFRADCCLPLDRAPLNSTGRRPSTLTSPRFRKHLMVMLSNVVLCRCGLGSVLGSDDACEGVPVPVCSGQGWLLMPVLSTVILSQARLVNVICSCHRGDREVQPPTISLQPTPLAGPQDRWFFENRFPIYQCDARRGAAELNRWTAAHQSHSRSSQTQSNHQQQLFDWSV